MAQKAKSRRPGTGRIAVAPQKNGRIGWTNGFYKAELEPPLQGKDHPLASIAGSYKDDSFWGEFVQIMKAERRRKMGATSKQPDAAEAEDE